MISFSRFPPKFRDSPRPTVFVRGQSLAAELALRFLWLAEVGLRQAGWMVGTGSFVLKDCEESGFLFNTCLFFDSLNVCF